MGAAGLALEGAAKTLRTVGSSGACDCGRVGAAAQRSEIGTPEQGHGARRSRRRRSSARPRSRAACKKRIAGQRARRTLRAAGTSVTAGALAPVSETCSARSRGAGHVRVRRNRTAARDPVDSRARSNCWWCSPAFPSAARSGHPPPPRRTPRPRRRGRRGGRQRRRAR